MTDLQAIRRRDFERITGESIDALTHAVRDALVFGVGALEQEQVQGLSPIATCKREFRLARKIIALVREHDAAARAAQPQPPA